MTMTTEAPATIPPVECAPWCEEGTGHTDANHTDDQWCRTRSTDVHLTTEGLVKHGEGDWRLGYASVYVLREAYSTRPVFQVVHNDITALSLSVGEARQLGNALLSLAGTVERA